MRDQKPETADLLRLLILAIRSRADVPTEGEAGTIANLWIRKRHMLTQDIAGQLWAALLLCQNLTDLQESVQRLAPRLRAVYDNERRIVDAAELSDHPGWIPPVLEAPSIDLSDSVFKLRPTFEARMVQWAVGQGGFWTASGLYRPRHSTSERSFEIVFDCGSSTAGVLSRALREYSPSGGRIDYLFLSHLDQDHTSGVAELLRVHRVDTVVMPLLDPAAMLLASARLAAQDGLSTEATELLTDPGTYFREKHVRRVILVQPAPEEGGPEAPRAPIPPESPNPTQSESDSPDAEIVYPRRRGAVIANPFPNTEVVPHATTFRLVGSDRRVFWQLAPYVHPFDPLRVGRFMQSAYKLLDGAGRPAKALSKHDALKSLLRSASGPRDLKRIYKLVRSDHNSISMSLFSCPRPNINGRSEFVIRMSRADGSEHEIRPSAPRFGWLHTGDSTLARESYRREWLNYYRDVLSHVAVLVAPHHGSRHNFHRDLFSIPRPPLALACASQTNSYGHPAAALARSARASRATFHQVDEQPGSAVTGIYAD